MALLLPHLCLHRLWEMDILEVLVHNDKVLLVLLLEVLVHNGRVLLVLLLEVLAYNDKVLPLHSLEIIVDYDKARPPRIRLSPPTVN